LFAWLPPVARKRVRLARLFLKQAWPSDLPQENWRKVEEIATALATLVARRNDALRQQQLLIQRGEAVIAQERQRLQDWKVRLDPLAQVGNESEAVRKPRSLVVQLSSRLLTISESRIRSR